jgi:hypothetical protein
LVQRDDVMPSINLAIPRLNTLELQSEPWIG